MTDIREALAQVIAGDEWDWSDAEIADAILAEFDVTPRGEGASDFDLPPEAVEAAIIAHHNFVLGEDVPLTKREIGIVFQAWHAALTAALAHIATLPSVEDVARALYRDDAAHERVADDWVDLSNETREWYRDNARAVLALLPGRTEAEVKAEALREAADWLADMDDGRDTAQHRAGRDIIARIRDRAARLSRGEGS